MTKISDEEVERLKDELLQKIGIPALDGLDKRMLEFIKNELEKENTVPADLIGRLIRSTALVGKHVIKTERWDAFADAVAGELKRYHPHRVIEKVKEMLKE